MLSSDLSKPPARSRTARDQPYEAAAELSRLPPARSDAESVKRSRLVAALMVAALAVGGILGWAASILFSPPPPLPEGARYSVVEVREGELSRSVSLGAAAAWSGGDRLVNQATGVLTQRLVASGDTVNSGDIVYTVDLAPVAVAVGDVPAFRDLEPGLQGDDVRQLQQMLIDTGHRTAEADGYFSSATLEQYRAWQRAAGFSATSAVPLGSLLFVQRLPAVAGWNDETQANEDGVSPSDPKGVVGTKLADGDVVAQFLPPVPSFSIDLPTGQRRLVDAGMPVALTFGQYQWNAIIDTIGAQRQDGSAVATLEPAEGAVSICGEDCAAIPLAGAGSIGATITVVAPTQGLLVPSAALAVAADGSTAIVTEDGETLPVTVVAVVSGQALIEGAAAGTRVRAPAQPSDGAELGTSVPNESGPETTPSPDTEPEEGEPDE